MLDPSQEPDDPPGAPRIAVIDIGTNTLLLLVAEIRHRDGHLQLAPIHEACEFGRLGQGLDATGVLDPSAVARSLDIVRSYRATMDRLGVVAVRAVGTQALREADNATDFVTPAEDLLGSPIEVIAGDDEARLVYRAVAEGLPRLRGERFIIADVGGGSTEIITSSSDGADIASYISVPIGSVRMHERHLHDDPPTTAQVAALMDDIDRSLSGLSWPTGARLVGSAGTATTIASMALLLEDYDGERVQGHTMTRAAVEGQFERLLALSVAERCELPGLPRQRADVIDAGVAIFVRLLRHLATDEFVINDRGVRWGVAHELALAHTSSEP